MINKSQYADKHAQVVEKPAENRGRTKRIPINGQRDRLTIQGTEPGWHYFMCNEDKLDTYLDAGYSYVTHSCKIGDRRIDAASIMGGRISIPVGNQLVGYLLRCPLEVLQEELQAVNDLTDENERMMKRVLNDKSDGRYGEVTVKSKLEKE